MADASPADLARAENAVIIASTWGEGDPPQRAEGFLAALMDAGAPRLEKLRYAVLALGDRAYARFCETGRRIDERLAELGAARLAERIECDLDYAGPASGWIEKALPLFAPPAAAPAPAGGPEGGPEGGDVIHVDFARSVFGPTNPFPATLVERTGLRSSRADGEALHLELDLEGAGFAWEPGDSLAFHPRNAPMLAAAILTAVGQEGNAALAEALIGERDITTLTRPMVEKYRELTGDAALGKLLGEEGRAEEYLAGRQPLDLFEDFPHALAPEALSFLLRKLPPRAYSIASSRKLTGSAAHLLVATVRYQTQGRARGGVASLDLAERHDAGGKIHVHLKPNPHFRLPADPATRVIMIGPGTGVAPFRAFLQEREAMDAGGRHLALLRPPALHARLPLPARMAGMAEERDSGTDRPRLLARPAGENLRPGPDVGGAARPLRVDRGGRACVRVRRRQGDGARRARDAAADHRRSGRMRRGGGGGALGDMVRGGRYLGMSIDVGAAAERRPSARRGGGRAAQRAVWRARRPGAAFARDRAAFPGTDRARLVLRGGIGGAAGACGRGRSSDPGDLPRYREASRRDARLSRPLIARLGLSDVRSMRPEAAPLAAEDPEEWLWNDDPDRCCHLRKVLPLEAALRPFSAWITGRKRYQGGARGGLASFEADAAGRIKLNPLAAWQPDEIAAFLAARELPRHPLGARGFLSIGCIPCTRAVRPGEAMRAGRWADRAKTECGIHLSIGSE